MVRARQREPWVAAARIVSYISAAIAPTTPPPIYTTMAAEINNHSPSPVPRQIRRKPHHRTVTTAGLQAATGPEAAAAAAPAAAGAYAGRPPLTWMSVKSMHL